MIVINKKTFSKSRWTSYRNTSWTLCFWRTSNRNTLRTFNHRRAYIFNINYRDLSKKINDDLHIAKNDTMNSCRTWEIVFELIATNYHVNAKPKRLTQKRTKNTVNVINKRTFSKTRQTSYWDASRTSCLTNVKSKHIENIQSSKNAHL
jgi:hypothetical protein